MQYLCLVYARGDGLQSPAGAMTSVGPGDDRERPAAGPTLPVSGSVMTVHSHDGRVSVREGRAAGWRERLPDCYLLEARDLNDAIRIAARLPSAGWGGVELRPISPLTGREPRLLGELDGDP